MPSTVNGIGTTYYGKKNLTKANGTCERCKYFGPLESYETGHYFVVLYIPLIPLGRKQIIDYCPNCTAHRAMSLRAWVEIKQQALANSTEQLAKNISDPNTALQHLGALGAFGELNEAKDLAEAIESQHAASAETQFRLGAWHEQHGNESAALRCFERAYELEPQHPFIARAKAMTLMQRGDLDGARRLLQSVQPAGSEHFDPALYFHLAQLYQKGGKDREALELLGLLKDRSDWSRNREYRRTVARSEKRLGSAQPMLGHIPFWKRRGFWLTLGAILLVSGFFGGNFFWGQRHRLHVVNGLDHELRIQIDGRPELVVGAGGRQETTVGEGPHRVTVLRPGGNSTPAEFLVQTPFWTRWFYRPVMLLDPLRTCVVFNETTKYTETPTDDDGTIDIRAGEVFVKFPPADYLFCEFPDSLQVSDRAREVIKSRVDFQRLEPDDILNLPDFPPERQLELAEHLAELNVKDEKFLVGYYMVADANNAISRFRNFLETKLALRPVAIAAHRIFQELAPAEGIPADELVARYDKELASEPQNADLLYLRGRLESSVAKANTFFSQALAAQSQHRHARQATAFGLLARGEYAAAKPLLQELHDENPEDPTINQYLSDCFVALKQPVAALEIIRGTWGATDADNATLQTLKHVATVLELPPAERAGLPDSFAPYQNRAWLEAEIAQAHIQFFLGYYQHDAKQMTEAAARLVENFDESTWYRFVAAIEAGNAEEAVKWADEDPDALSIADTLVLAVALHAAGNTKLAEHWFEEGLDRLRRNGRAEEAMAALLDASRRGPVDPHSVVDLQLEPQDKRVFLLALNAFGASPDGQLPELIRKFNFDVEFPYYFIQNRLPK